MLRDGKTSIFVCKGTYQENVILAGISNVSLYGGFSCDDWTYTCERPAVGPLTGYALEIDNVSSVTVTDMHFETQKRMSNGESSIAVFASQSGVTFTRTELVANAGAAGSAGAKGVNGAWSDPAGGGAGMTCSCTTGGSTTGGAGGAAGEDGTSGTPSIAENPPGQPTPHTGQGGTGGQQCIFPGGLGLPGADAPSGTNAAASDSLGQLTASGWLPGDGVDGTDGQPGQGGGGGGGRAGAGGGGGCGGCGGTKGTAGHGGGSSVALLSFQSTVQLIGCALTTNQAGSGGAGGNGGDANEGASGVSGTGNGCGGGDGGYGGAGGAGSGGAGGISAGVLYSGSAPVPDSDTTIHPGAAGVRGVAGMSGSPSVVAGNQGLDGKSGQMVSVDDWTVTP